MVTRFTQNSVHASWQYDSQARQEALSMGQVFDGMPNLPAHPALIKAPFIIEKKVAQCTPVLTL